MPRTLTKLTLLLTIVTAACGHDVEVGDATPDAAPRARPTVPTAATFVPDEAIVEVTAPLTIGAPVTLGGQRVVPISALSPGIYQVRLVDAARAVAGVDRAARTLDMIAALRASGDVRGAVPNGLVEFSATINDPVFSVQAWHYGVAGITGAWDRTMGAPAVRLAILDSGTTPHPDLTFGAGFDAVDLDTTPLDLGTYHHGTMVAGLAGARANSIGGIGVCSGCTLIPVRISSAASVAIGLNWLANVDGASGAVLGPRQADVVNMSFNYYRYGDGGPTPGPRVRCADADPDISGIRTALARARAQGLFVVGAAGNGGRANTPATDGPEFPADCPDVFSVAAISAPDLGGPGFTRAWYSSHGPGIDLVAPGGGRNNPSNGLAFYGTDIGPPAADLCRHLGNDGSYTGTAGIVSTWAVGVTGSVLGQTVGDFCYRYGSGTSFAAPHVTGVAGLMLSARTALPPPNLSPMQLEHVLRLTAKPDGADVGFNDPLSCAGCGAGLVDADAAVAAVQQAAPGIATAAPSSYDFGSVAVGSSSAATISMGNVGFATVQVSSSQPMGLTGPFQFAYSSGCTSGQTCARTFSVLVGGTANVPIRCTPTSTGAQTGTLYIPSSSVGQLRVPLACNGVGSPPVLSAPGSFAFGNVMVGNVADVSMTVTNTGGTPLTITTATLAGAAALTPTGALPTNIPANGGTGSIGLRCAPTTTGALASTLSITSNGGTATVSVTCTGVAPVLSAPGSFGFGNVVVGTTNEQVLIVFNTGGAPLTVTGATVTGGTAFTVVGTLPAGIGANGGAGAINLRCTPPTVGLKTATLNLTSTGGTATVALSCTGVAPVLSAPGSLAFGEVRVGANSDRMLTVTNTGTSPLTITGATPAGAAAITRPGTLPASIPANGGTGTIALRCAPTAAGALAATLSITSDGGTASVSLTCTGVAPVLSAPGSLPFGDVRVGTVLDRGVQILNLGTAPMTVISATTYGDAAFSRLTMPTVPLPPNGGSGFVLARCAPTTVGLKTGVLVIVTDGGSASVSLTCTGTAPQLTSTPSWLEFSSVLRGTTATQYLYLTNPGTAPLTVTSATTSGAPFTIATTLPLTVPVGGMTALAVRCSPTNVGYNQGTITVTHDAGAPLTVGTGCNGVEGLITVLAPAGSVDLFVGESVTATIRNDGVGPLYVDQLRFSQDAPGLSFSGATLPVTLAVGQTLSWNVDCGLSTSGYQSSAKVYAKHNGVQNGAFFSVSCTQNDIYIEPPVIEPIEDPYVPPEEK